MIITRSWLNEWIDIENISTKHLSKTLNEIGLEVDRIHFYNIPEKIIFAKVLKCEKHPDADKLNVCQVDLGDKQTQIVCGASNVRAGLTVAVASIGAVMPNGLEIKPVKLRGVESNGMICSASEVGIESSQEGILELDESIGEIKLGSELKENRYLCDELIEIELTANRGDCLSVRGVARDLSASFNIALKLQTQRDKSQDKNETEINLFCEDESNIQVSYKSLNLQDLKIPLLIDIRLSQIDAYKNNFIDCLINYATHSVGVLLKAYNYNLFCKEDTELANINIQKTKDGFSGFDFINGYSYIGVEQDDNLKSCESKIIIEASYIYPEIISQLAQENKIKTGDIYYKSSRGSEPDITLGLDFLLKTIQNNSNSNIYTETKTIKQKTKLTSIIVNKQNINDIIGTEIKTEKIIEILNNLGFKTDENKNQDIKIGIPPHRHDIINNQDIIEEIVRLVGIDNIPSKPFILKEENRFSKDYLQYQKRRIFRHKAAQSGFFESIHFVFDEKKVLQEYGFETTDEDLELLNPIVNTFDTLRPTLLTGLLKASSLNAKNGYSSIRLFEIGSVFSKTREESLKMAILFSGDIENQSLSNTGKPKTIDFPTFSQKISDIIGEFELSEYETKHSLSHIYQSAEILIDGEKIGEMFKVHPNIAKRYSLGDTFVCEFDFDLLPHDMKIAKEQSKYQATFRDLSLIIPKDLNYQTIKNSIKNTISDEVVRFYPIDSYSDKTLGDKSSFSIRFVLQSNSKTLEEEDILNTMQTILNTLQKELNIGLR